MIVMSRLSEHVHLTARRTMFSVVLFQERVQNPELGVLQSARQSNTEMSSTSWNVTCILLSDAQAED